jgi:hypothetical protein
MNRISLFIASVFLLLLFSCKEDEVQLSVEEKQKQMLSGMWQLTTATRDSEAIEGYEDFKLVFATSGNLIIYTSLNRPEFSPWQSGGVLSFGSEPVSELVRDAGTDEETLITYTVSERELGITFTYSGGGFEGGKVKAVQGNWEFRFTK